MAVGAQDLGNLKTVSETMEALGVGRTTVYALMKNRELNYTQVGGRRRITERSLVDYLARRETRADAVKPPGRRESA